MAYRRGLLVLAPHRSNDDPCSPASHCSSFLPALIDAITALRHGSHERRCQGKKKVNGCRLLSLATKEGSKEDTFLETLGRATPAAAGV